MDKQKRGRNEQTFLFQDGHSNYVHKGDYVYYIVLSEGGKYKVGWQLADEVHAQMQVWSLLIGLSLVKGLYLEKDYAEELCEDYNIGASRTIDKSVFGNLLNP